MKQCSFVSTFIQKKDVWTVVIASVLVPLFTGSHDFWNSPKEAYPSSAMISVELPVVKILHGKTRVNKYKK